MEEKENPHKAGFIGIIGAPNVGKSTLMNALVGEKLSIITPKAQTTRHKILGIVNGEDFQMVFTDTPGIIDPHYTLHKAMMHAVDESVTEADLLLYVVEPGMGKPDEAVMKKLLKAKCPLYVIINKIDTSDQAMIGERIKFWQELLNPKQVVVASALNKFNIDAIKDVILQHLPESPAFFPKDQLTDKPEKFFAAEIIREKIFLYYKKEIPYSCEVVIESFKDEEEILNIEAIIYVMRETQKIILIGKNGIAIKQIGVSARKGLEQFFGKHVFIKLLVKVKDNWRENEMMVKRFGYDL